jgi:hypothetical protein
LYCAGVRSSFCQKAHRPQQEGQRRAVVARITGKREEYVIDGIRDPEDIWGEEAEEEFIEVRCLLCFSNCQFEQSFAPAGKML